MHWKQVAVALVFASISSYLAIRKGIGVTAAIGLGILTYVLFRVLAATLFRTRYWLSRGTKGAYSTSCPQCGQYIYRKQGDWILECYRCGWKTGLPILRWLTNSVPSIQFRRSLSLTRVTTVLTAVGLILAGTPAVTSQLTQSEDISLQSPIVVESPQASTQAGRSQGDDSEKTTSDGRTVDFRASEREILRRTNKIRSQRGLNALSESDFLHQKALKHSRDMAENDYYSHAGPNGESPESRLSSIGENCGGSSSENIHRGELFVEMRIYGSSETVFMGSPGAIGRYAVQGWMNSEGHRENMLKHGWNRAGVGVYSSDSEVYMTIIFC